MSADAAKIAFAVIKDVLASSGQEEEKKEKIILATVKGDIHDIGKNIVKVLLENYGFDVIDLGKDVPPEAIVEKAVEENVTLVGLSALMTTTVVSMEETIKLLREKKPDCKVMVGGAVLNQDYADMIGADFYGKDAMQSVHYAQKFFGMVEQELQGRYKRSKLYVKMLKKFGKFFCICYNMHKSRRKENDSMGGMTRWHFFQH